MPSLLVIDDEPSVCYSVRRVFTEEGMSVLTASTAAAGLQMLREHDPDVVLLDLQLPDRTGLEVFQDIQALDPKRPVIFITAHGTTETAIEAMKRGAFDYLIKPVDLEQLSHLLDRALEARRLMRRPALLPADEATDRIVGRSRIMQEMCKAIGRIAPQDVNVLIVGESGTGKELVARALYHHGRRADRPFLALNCAAIPETLLESELFGHEQGAFTGAQRRHIGKFEQCNGGTLFLDEIADMPLPLQAKMLRVLQDQRFERLGGQESIQTQVRVLAATNQDLEGLVAQGRFRKDLYYRLNAVTIHVPPLRDRREDAPELAHYFLDRFNREMALDMGGFAPETLDLLQSYSWPGNVRELQGAVRHAMLNATGPLILPDFLPTSLFRKPPVVVPGQADLGAVPEVQVWIESLLRQERTDLHRLVLGTVERLLLHRVLQHTQGHQTRASELLGINRTTLRTKLRTLGLAVDKIVIEEGDTDEPGL